MEPWRRRLESELTLPYAYAQVLPEGSVVVERLTSQCEAVVNHLRDTTSGKVSVARMELYFKLDAQNRCEAAQAYGMGKLMGVIWEGWQGDWGGGKAQLGL